MAIMDSVDKSLLRRKCGMHAIWIRRWGYNSRLLGPLTRAPRRPPKKSTVAITCINRQQVARFAADTCSGNGDTKVGSAMESMPKWID